MFNARDSIPNPSTALRAGAAGYWTAYGFAREIPLKNVAAGRYLLKVEAGLRDLRQAQVAKPVIRETLITIQR